MKKLIFIFLIGLLPNLKLFSQDAQKQWMKYSTLKDAGFSADKLRIAKDYFDSTNAVAMMLIKDGHVVDAWGDIERRYKCHSVRKSLLNVLYGVQAKNGVIDVNKTIGEVGIKEKIELTELEKSAKIKDLLTTRSGVYLNAALEAPDSKNKPKRGSYKPGENQFYNNWDYNVLGSIYNIETKSDIFVDFSSYVAIPTGMEDYRIIDGTYEYEESSIHPGYPIKMSTRDLARFGQLYIQNGQWNGKQIINNDWIKESIFPYTSKDDMGNSATGYGYLWWLLNREGEPKGFFALGWGEQYLGIYPEENIVIVLRGDSYFGEFFSRDNQREKLIELLFSAEISNVVENPKLIPLKREKRKFEKFNLSKQQLLSFTGRFELEENNISEINKEFEIKYVNDNLIIDGLHYAYKFRLIPLSENELFIEDIELFLTFAIDKMNKKIKPTINKTRQK